MSLIKKSIIDANRKYVADYRDAANLPIAPGKKLAILTCMDARLDPLAYAGLRIGDAHIIRNAGGRASDDAIRSLVISYKLLGTRDWLVVHHTECGMETFNDAVMRSLLEESLEVASHTESGWTNSKVGGGSTEGNYIDWLTFSDNESSVVDDMRRISNHPLVPGFIQIHGFIFDVKNGQLIAVPSGA